MMVSHLQQVHRSEARQLMQFHQFEVPATYLSPEEEFDMAMSGPSLIDRSWIGRIKAIGPDTLDLFHRLSTNDVQNLVPGQARGTVFTTEKGRIVDYVHLLARRNSVDILCSPGNESSFTHWVEKYCIMEDVKLESVTHETAMMSIVGPRSPEVVAKIFAVSLQENQLEELDHALGHIVLARQQEFGLDTVNIITSAKSARDLWDFVSGRGSSLGLIRLGVQAYEVLRITRGMPAVNGEISNDFNPYESGLLHAVNFSKGCYIGQEVIARLDTYQKIQRNLVGLLIDEVTGEPKLGDPVSDSSAVIGVLTSIAAVPIRGKYAGIAVIKKGTAKPGDTVAIGGGGNFVRARVSQFPIDL